MTSANENARRQPGADTAETYTAKDTAGRGIRQQAKRTIVALALWGFLPAGFASWLLLRLGRVAE